MNARRRSSTLGIAVGGVLLGHWLTYRAVSPDAHARLRLLRHTGHAYLGPANDLALVAALTAFAALFVGQLSATARTGRMVGVTRRIVAFQVSAFVLMEVLERVTAGAPLDGLIRTGILPIGVGVQVAVALLAAVAIRWLVRAADHVAAVLARPGAPRPRGVVAIAVPTAIPVPVRRHLSAAGVRGPPSAG
jgi:hypothetical protein